MNIVDPLQTEAPQFTLAELMCIAGGPFTVRLGRGYITTWVEDQLKERYEQNGDYHNIHQYHQDASEVNHA